MTKKQKKRPLLPKYHGRKWLDVRLPDECCDWSVGGEQSIVTEDDDAGLIDVLRELEEQKLWRWPKRKHYFLSDLHADPDAFAASLVASGGVVKGGPHPTDFKLSAAGKEANFIIGGDCFDKGPSNLELLRAVRHLKDERARLRILAGNHDIRLLFGMRVVGNKKDVRNEHFFIRSGQKIIPLLKEVWDTYLKGKKKRKALPDTATCRARLFPRESWFAEFPKIRGGDISPTQVEREVSRISKKSERFESLCGEAGLDLQQVYAATIEWKKLFLVKGGEFHWFYKNLRLCYRSGSFLFVHAGVDDSVAKLLTKHGVARLNESFRTAVREAPFDFYYGALCNTIRTKYRDVDRLFSHKGADNIRCAGITAIVHGHRNLHHGQRLSLRRSLINFECDTSLDRHTRRLENVDGRGASVTILEPEGRILGVSSDFPKIKVFDPMSTLAALKAVAKHNRKGAKS